jgi:tungstate transport system permease protein
MNAEIVSAVNVSLYTSILSTVFASLIGIPLACILAFVPFKGKNGIVTVLKTLLAMPTVVIGLLAFSMLCRGSPLGRYHLLFSQTAIIIGQTILALPIVIVFSFTALKVVVEHGSETLRTFGTGTTRLFVALVSEARYGILAAIAATFGRLIGEVGISMMLGGNIAGYTRTMTTAIALETSKGELVYGLQLGAILMVIALVVNIGLKFLRGSAE